MNSNERWARVFSDHARAALEQHMNNGGSIDPDAVETGFTVEKLKKGLRERCPTETLPDDDVLYLRLALVFGLWGAQRLSSDLQTMHEAIQGLRDELNAKAGDPV